VEELAGIENLFGQNFCIQKKGFIISLGQKYDSCLPLNYLLLLGFLFLFLSGGDDSQPSQMPDFDDVYGTNVNRSF